MSLSRLLAMRTEPKRTIRESIYKRAKSGKCLLCDKKSFKRGVCTTHHALYMRLRGECDGDNAKLEFEDDQIAEGKILGSGVIIKLKRDNPFVMSK